MINEQDLKEVTESLKSLSIQMREVTEIIEATKKHPAEKDISKLVLNKRIEDGLIENFYKASEYQLTHMRDVHYWKYYKEDVMFSHKPDKRIKDIINHMIQTKNREAKLKRILKIK